MIRRSVLLLLALVPMIVRLSLQAHAQNTQPRYTPVALCEIALHDEKAFPKYVSLDAVYVSAIPHGLFLKDPRRERCGLQIDFPDTGLDPSVAFIKDHMLEIGRATGTFRGILKRDRVIGRRYLWLQSVTNFQSAYQPPELYIDEPIRLPKPHYLSGHRVRRARRMADFGPIRSMSANSHRGLKATVLLLRLRHGRKRCLSPLESSRPFRAPLRGFGSLLLVFPRTALRLSWANILRPLRGECLRAVFMPLGGPEAHGATTEVVPLQNTALI
jgi:hypothetical protein